MSRRNWKRKSAKKKMSIPDNFSNLWPKSSDRKYHAWKNCKTQSLRNKMLTKRKKNHSRRFKIKKITIKRIRVKIKIKIN
jgi:hypothetical protein